MSRLDRLESPGRLKIFVVILVVMEKLGRGTTKHIESTRMCWEMFPKWSPSWDVGSHLIFNIDLLQANHHQDQEHVDYGGVDGVWNTLSFKRRRITKHINWEDAARRNGTSGCRPPPSGVFTKAWLAKRSVDCQNLRGKQKKTQIQMHLMYLHGFACMEHLGKGEEAVVGNRFPSISDIVTWPTIPKGIWNDDK